MQRFEAEGVEVTENYANEIFDNRYEECNYYYEQRYSSFKDPLHYLESFSYGRIEPFESC